MLRHTDVPSVAPIVPGKACAACDASRSMLRSSMYMCLLAARRCKSSTSAMYCASKLAKIQAEESVNCCPDVGVCSLGTVLVTGRMSSGLVISTSRLEVAKGGQLTVGKIKTARTGYEAR